MKEATLLEYKMLFAQLLEFKALPCWDREFLEDLQKRARAVSGDNSFVLTAKQLDQLDRIKGIAMKKSSAKKEIAKEDLLGDDEGPAQAGHNNPPTEFGKSTSKQLKSFVERIERMNEEAAAITADRREIYNEAKANGFDTKTIRRVVKLRELSTKERGAQEHLFDTYCSALGLL